jgi:hypothetical protein
MATKRAIELLANTKPARKIEQVWQVWNDVEAFRSHGWAYDQIANAFHTHYGICISSSELRKTCFYLRRRVKAGLKPPDTPGESARSSLDKAANDPWEATRNRIEAARAEDRLVDDVFKRKTVRDLIRKDPNDKSGG